MHIKMKVFIEPNFDFNAFLHLYPELKDGSIGVYNITALQVASAFTKIGLISTLRELVKLGSEYVNTGDQLGRTPLHYAALNGNTELVQLLLESGAETDCKFKYRENGLRTSSSNYEKWNRLFMALTPPDIWGRTPLHLAAKAGHAEVVKVLIEKSADVNVEDNKGITPLLLAGCIGNRNTFENIVKILVENGADVTKKNIITGTTALFHAVALKSTKATKCLLDAGAWIDEGPCGETELHEAAANHLLEILHLFMEDKRLTLANINKRDKCGRTPAHRAAYCGSKEGLKLLLLNGADMTHVSATNDTVLDTIFSRLERPALFVKEILDYGVTKDKDTGQIILDFSILTRSGHEAQTNCVYNIVNTSQQNEHIEILEHPLIETFLRLKWRKIRWFFYLLICLYTIFVLTLSVYVFVLIHEIPHYIIVASIVRYTLIILAGGLLSHAIMQSVIAWKIFYKKFELWMSVTCTSLSFAVAVGHKIDGSETLDWELHAASIAILLAWTELMLLIGRFPSYGYYALMFAAVLQNVVKVLFIFICLVVGFALSFSIQFHNYEEFKDPWRAVIKTIVMMMGEFEYMSLFTTPENCSTASDSGISNRDLLNGLPTTSRVIFLMFIVVASIVLMNLLVGLAVSDIQGLTKLGNVKRLEKQAEFLHQFEKVTCRMINMGTFPKCLINILKRKRSISSKFIVQPDMFGPNRNGIFGQKKLPTELYEAITNMVNKGNQNDQDIFKNENLPVLIQTLRSIIKAYESRTSNKE